jgi:tetratricopeptide (TPR) repeat protein
VHIAQICQIVQGMPLGIELASAWVKVRACADIAREIEHTFDFLATTLRDAPARQHSLRAVFDYSWQMLSAEEQRVLRALSVFRGGFTRDAAEQVAGATLSALAALIAPSLLRHAAMGRYEMHEMVRQFAEEKLGPADELYLRHAQFYLEWIKGARKELLGAQAATWLNRIEAERANLRAALAWTLEHEHIEMTVQLNRNLWRFWYIRRYFDEGRHWTQVTLDAARRKQLSAEFMVIALDGAAGLANDVGDYAEARQLHAECLSIQRARGDTRGIAISLNNLALVAENQGDYDFAIGCYEECLGLCRQLGEPQLVAIALTNLGNVSQFKGDYERAIALQEESVAIRRPLGDQWGLATSLMNLAEALLYRGEEQRAISLCEECLALHRQMGNERNTAYPLATLGRAMLMRGDTAQAEIFLRTSLTLLSQSADKTNILDVLTRIVYVAVAQGKFARAATLFGAEETLRSAIGHPLQPIDHAEHSRHLNAARNQLGATEFDATFAAGRALTLEQAVALALKES